MGRDHEDPPWTWPEAIFGRGLLWVWLIASCAAIGDPLHGPNLSPGWSVLLGFVGLFLWFPGIFWVTQPIDRRARRRHQRRCRAAPPVDGVRDEPRGAVEEDPTDDGPHGGAPDRPGD